MISWEQFTTFAQANPVCTTILSIALIGAIATVSILRPCVPVTALLMWGFSIGAAYLYDLIKTADN